MKTLYMVRHAKSSWKHDLDDHQRPLKGRGKRDASLVSSHVKDHLPPPEVIITSDANRALSTAVYFKEAFEIPEDKFNTHPDLYDFGGRNVLEIIKTLSNDLNRVMIVGHNHAFTSVANMLGNVYIDNLPTCGFVCIEFEDETWQTITTGKTQKTIFPRDLKE